jgi:hypothetical protein
VSYLFKLDDDGNAIACDHNEWAPWFVAANRVVDHTMVGPFMVSTIFVSIWMGEGDSGLPLLWETMVFKSGAGAISGGDRYSSQADARAGHERIVEMMRKVAS